MNRTDAILIEDMNHKLDAIIEGQTAMAHVPAKLESIDNRLRHVESELQVVMHVLTDHSSDIEQLKHALAI